MLLLLLACAPEKPEDTPPTGDTQADDTGSADLDGDGWTVAEGDCDDADEYSNPDAGDVPYDGVDQDCDGADVTDYDGDGWDGGDGGDCNDSNPEINPGVVETVDDCYNQLDEDCDGDPDDDYDCDNDGYVLADDCDDFDPAINPSAADAWYDGVDTDCDQRDDFDQDEDGDPSDQYGGADCDDVDATRSSLLVEAWDGADEDCTGDVDDVHTWEAPSNWDGSAYVYELSFGWALETLDDRSGDGVRDALVGVPGTYDADGNVPGRVYLLAWAEGLGVPEDEALAAIEGTATKELGFALLELADGSVAVGAPDRYTGDSGAYLFAGDDLVEGASLTLSDATLSIEFILAGGDLAAWGDDLLVATANYDTWGTEVYKFAVAGATGTVTESAATWSFTATGDFLDLEVHGDVDGDGLAEVAIATEGFSNVPRVAVVTGEQVAAGTSDDAVALTGLDTDVALSGADVDGDGHGELLVSDRDGGDGVGVVYVIPGLDGGDVADLAVATVT
ncbi:MAG: MopE-related protein, partial [Myxococcota bacterium]